MCGRGFLCNLVVPGDSDRDGYPFRQVGVWGPVNVNGARPTRSLLAVVGRECASQSRVSCPKAWGSVRIHTTSHTPSPGRARRNVRTPHARSKAERHLAAIRGSPGANRHEWTRLGGHTPQRWPGHGSPPVAWWRWGAASGAQCGVPQRDRRESTVIEYVSARVCPSDPPFHLSAKCPNRAPLFSPVSQWSPASGHSSVCVTDGRSAASGPSP